jgi:hypothetical protein
MQLTNKYADFLEHQLEVALAPSALVVFQPSGGSFGDPVLGFDFGSKRADLLAMSVGPKDFDVPYILALKLFRLKAQRGIAIAHPVRLCKKSCSASEPLRRTQKKDQFNSNCTCIIHS